MMAPMTSNRISVKDIAHQAMRLQPAVAAGACSRREMVTLARMMIADECYAAKAEAGLFTTSAGETEAGIRHLCADRILPACLFEARMYASD